MSNLYVSAQGKSPWKLKPDPKVRWAIRAMKQITDYPEHICKNVLLWRKARGLSWEPSAIRVID